MEDVRVTSAGWFVERWVMWRTDRTSSYWTGPAKTKVKSWFIIQFRNQHDCLKSLQSPFDLGNRIWKPFTPTWNSTIYFLLYLFLVSGGTLCLIVIDFLFYRLPFLLVINCAHPDHSSLLHRSQYKICFTKQPSFADSQDGNSNLSFTTSYFNINITYYLIHKALIGFLCFNRV